MKIVTVRYLLFIVLIMSMKKISGKLGRRLRYRCQLILYKASGVFLEAGLPHLKGFRTLHFSKITVKHRRGLRIAAEDVVIQIAFEKLLFHIDGKCVKDVKVRTLHIFLPDASKLNPNNLNTTEHKQSPFNWQSRYFPIFQRMVNIIFALPSSTGCIDTFQLTTSFKGVASRIEGFKLAFSPYSISGLIQAYWNSLIISIPFSSEINKVEQKILVFSNTGDLIVHHVKKEIARMKDWHLQFSFLDNYNYIIECKINGCYLDHPIISNETFRTDLIELEIEGTFTDELFKIANNSTIELNGIPLTFSVLNDAESADLIRCVGIFLVDGTTFFQAYPFFSMESLKSLKGDGEIIIQMEYVLSLDNNKYYYFNTEVLKNDLQIFNFGDADLSYVNREFSHKIPLNECKDKIINISTHNIDFISLQQIPTLLKKIIILTEDPHFERHTGIDSYFLGVAITTNLLHRKFVKGASTLTMQLARNLFLHHSKNISRKLDEFIIAWLLEHQFKISKNRILELYINIIEFGVQVYGIKEATRYYFEKDVSELSLQEMLVLTYIIPRPKFFVEALLGNSPQLCMNLKRHIHQYAKTLLANKSITLEDYNNLDLVIRFKPEFGELDLNGKFGKINESHIIETGKFS